MNIKIDVNICDNEWYAINVMNEDIVGEGVAIIKGDDLKVRAKKHNWRFNTLRPATPEEIPKPEPTMLERIEAAYEGKEVVLLEWDEHCDDVYMLSMVYKGCNWRHIKAQSMRNFQGYVYDYADKLQVFMSPVQYDAVKGKCIYIQPVAVLFNK